MSAGGRERNEFYRQCLGTGPPIQDETLMQLVYTTTCDGALYLGERVRRPVIHVPPFRKKKREHGQVLPTSAKSPGWGPLLGKLHCGDFALAVN